MAMKPVGIKPLDDFFDYVLETYIQPGCNFPPEMWASHSVSEDRTTNGNESFHSKFNAEFPSAHPNIFCFIKTTLKIQADVYIKLKKKKPRSLSKCQQKKDQFLAEKVFEYAVDGDRLGVVKNVS